MSSFTRHKGAMSRVRGETKTAQKSRIIRDVNDIISNRLSLELTRLGFTKDARITLQERFKSLDDLRYMNMKTLAVALLMYSQNPGLHPVVNETKGVIGINIEAYIAVFNGANISTYVDLLYPSAKKLIKR